MVYVKTIAFFFLNHIWGKFFVNAMLWSSDGLTGFISNATPKVL